VSLRSTKKIYCIQLSKLRNFRSIIVGVENVCSTFMLLTVLVCIRRRRAERWHSLKHGNMKTKRILLSLQFCSFPRVWKRQENNKPLVELIFSSVCTLVPEFSLVFLHLSKKRQGMDSCVGFCGVYRTWVLPFVVMNDMLSEEENWLWHSFATKSVIFKLHQITSPRN
jgi:hypothetical protein